LLLASPWATVIVSVNNKHDITLIPGNKYMLSYVFVDITNFMTLYWRHCCLLNKTYYKIIAFCWGQYEFVWTLRTIFTKAFRLRWILISKVHKNLYWPQQKTNCIISVYCACVPRMFYRITVFLNWRIYIVKWKDSFIDFVRKRK
jgi:hypothetical protein